jgi:hypothetical protein
VNASTACWSLWPVVSPSGARSDGHRTRAWTLWALGAAFLLVLAVEPARLDLLGVVALAVLTVRLERRGSPRPTPPRSPR